MLLGLQGTWAGRQVGINPEEKKFGNRWVKPNNFLNPFTAVDGFKTF